VIVPCRRFPWAIDALLRVQAADDAAVEFADVLVEELDDDPASEEADEVSDEVEAEAAEEFAEPTFVEPVPFLLRESVR
jgi:hypothetical protein